MSTTQLPIGSPGVLEHLRAKRTLAIEDQRAIWYLNEHEVMTGRKFAVVYEVDSVHGPRMPPTLGIRCWNPFI